MTTATPTLHRSAHSSAFVRLTIGFGLIYLVLDRSATWTNSLFGEYGVLMCALVIAAALLVLGVVLNIVLKVRADPTSHNLSPFEVLGAIVLAGAVLGLIELCRIAEMKCLLKLSPK